jgi:glycosyltransferase involved in cell wall biosynthesis
MGKPAAGSPGTANFNRWTFMGCPLTRSEPDAHRIVHIGELTPRAGVAEFLSCAVAWAHSHPDMPIDITWLGEGDLLGVLRAQPVPANLTQTFARIPPSDRLAVHLGRCGLLAAPGLADSRLGWVAEAMAAGLPVLGSVRDPRVRALVAQGQSGWLFDPLRDSEMSAALTAAMSATAGRLDEMREAARARVSLLPAEPPGETVEGLAAAAFRYSLADNASA